MLHKIMATFHRCREEKFIRRLGRKLNLDIAQQARLSAVQASRQKALAEVEQVKTERHDMLLSLLSAPQLDLAEARHLLQIPQRVMDDHLPDVLEQFSAFHAGLSEQQRTRLVELLQRHRSGHCGCRH
ncbi:MAG: hypothetical protein OEZ39_18135 [Gammaproteobacteria bacterium]|nr:hypothetical protein [Gammaproteobacteria bacterium]MDH5653786.1 hypothetical protein [Gammaproteobacteria bacterium]